MPGVDKFTTGWDVDVGRGLESDEGLLPYLRENLYCEARFWPVRFVFLKIVRTMRPKT